LFSIFACSPIGHDSPPALQALARHFFCDLPMEGPDGSVAYLRETLAKQLGFPPPEPAK